MTSPLLRRWFGERTPRLLVAGDLMLDRYVWGEVERISPEAPVQVLRWREENEALGGAANVAHNLAALGCEVALLGRVGEDAEGRRLLALAEEAGIDASFVRRTPGAPTISKTRLIARSQHVLRVDKEGPDPAAGAAPADGFEDLLPAALAGRDGVICSDYLKGVLTPAFLRALTAAGGDRLPMVVDPKGEGYAKYRGARALTPNLAEVARAAGRPVRTEADLDAAVASLFEAAAPAWILVTRGAEGMTLFGPGGRVAHEPARALEVYDVTGAGDTAVALFGLALCGGAPAEEAARLANAGAGVAVGKVGTATVTAEDLEAALAAAPGGGAGKVLARDDLLRRLHAERGRGRRVVFTNGCFDLIHVGHVQYLQRARGLGDLLVVGLNDDPSVHRLKGPGRPLIGQRQRAELLAALECVDFVALFSEDTPLGLIEAIRPDVLVKGGDYAPDQVVGREAVERGGGRVEVLPFIEGISTSHIVETILRRYGPGTPGEEKP